MKKWNTIKKIIWFFIIVIILLSLASCEKYDDKLSIKEIETFNIPNINIQVENKISTAFIKAILDSGFSIDMNREKLTNLAKRIEVDGKSLYDKGLLYSATDLVGNSFAYGDQNNTVSYKEAYKNNFQNYGYDLYINNEKSNYTLPEGLSFKTTFRQFLNQNNLLEIYEKSKNQNSQMIEVYNNNSEKISMHLASFHGEIIDSTLDSATISIFFQRNKLG